MIKNKITCIKMLFFRFFLGKNKIMQKAIGQTEEESYKKNLFLLSEHLKGDCGLFLTNRNPKEIQK